MLLSLTGGHVQSVSAGEMMCEATLSFESVTITRTVVVDDGFTDDLTLEPADVIALGLGDPVGQVSMSLAQGFLT